MTLMPNDPIEAEARRLGITRLCHFTPSRNLLQIAAGKVGVLATARLEDDERAVFNPTDLSRLDGHKSHVSCSIEYPNGWYFEKKRLEEQRFLDWAVLLIDPRYIWAESTLFCPRNASAGYGREIVSGYDGFLSLYRDGVRGAYDVVLSRTELHLRACPTDDQAEVLVKDRIALADIISVAVKDTAQAKRQRAKLRLAGLDPDLFRYVIAPVLFRKRSLSAAIRRGERPAETPFEATS
jgi:hypothetical protein